MIDMKITDKEKKEMSEVSVLKDAPSYPYGLCLCVDSETFKKLGIPVPSLGDKLKLDAIVEVTALNQDRYSGDKKGVNVSLQITEMELEAVDAENKEASEVIYY